MIIVFTITVFMPCDLLAKEKTLKLASWGPTKHYIAVARKEWINEVNAACVGKIKIQDYPGGQLYGPKQMHMAVAKGSIDIGVILQPAMMAMVPMLQGVYLPFSFNSLEEVGKAYSGESLQIIEKALEKKRIKLIYTSYLDGVQFFSNKKNILTIDDFKGMRVLSASPMVTKIFTKLGAAPDTSTPQTEHYMALKRGVSDAMANSVTGGYFQKSHEVAPYVTKINLSFGTIFVCMNIDKWNGLPKEVQDIMLSSGKKKSAYTKTVAKGWEQNFSTAMVKEGAKVIQISTEEREKIKSISQEVWQEWAQKYGKDAQRLLELNTL